MTFDLYGEILCLILLIYSPPILALLFILTVLALPEPLGIFAELRPSRSWWGANVKELIFRKRYCSFRRKLVATPLRGSSGRTELIKQNARRRIDAT